MKIVIRAISFHVKGNFSNLNQSYSLGTVVSCRDEVGGWVGTLGKVGGRVIAVKDFFCLFRVF